jgi:hypothetical protein
MMELREDLRNNPPPSPSQREGSKLLPHRGEVGWGLLAKALSGDEIRNLETAKV